MNKFFRSAHSRHSGFSLIEVLIGAVILATGLLALSALQGSLARNAADARIRSQIAAALESAAEADRGTTDFTTVVATTRTVDVPGVGTVNVSSTGTGDCAYVNLTKGQNVACATGQGADADDAQYKRINYRASWTDSTGGTRSMMLTSIVSPRTIAGIKSLPFDTPTKGVNSMEPVVRTPNPEVAGMIPIAIGNSTDTAATNPKPTVYSGLVKKTTFEVLTYQGNQTGFGSDIVKQQRRVETAVVGCTCSRTNSADTRAQFQRVQWPAYWDGNRYTIYKPSGSATPYGETERGAQASGAVQDVLCTECCRDHHDAPGTTEVKFDPYRTGDHVHYSYNATTEAFDAATGPTSSYMEACRMIRVDGFWRTAQDLDSKYFGLLATDNSARLPTPAVTPTQANYETFVIDYITQYYMGTPTQTGDQLYAARSLAETSPASISISIPNPADSRFLHSRGLYIDKVEPVAQAKITSAISGCTRTPAVECILPLLSFTSINLTELSSWRSSEPNKLTVDTLGVNLFDPDLPNRGTVDATSAAVNNEAQLANAYARKSNSGLIERPLKASTGLEIGIDPQDDTAFSDSQSFTPVTGSSLAIRNITVRIDGWSGSTNRPKPKWRTSTGGGNCRGTASGDFICPIDTSSGAVDIIVGRYNYQTSVGAKRATVQCPTLLDGRSFTYPNDNDLNGVTIPACQNVQVNSVTVSSGVTKGWTLGIPASTNDAKVGTTSGGWEETLLPFTAAPNGALITVVLADQGDAFIPDAASCSPALPAPVVTSVVPGTCP